MTTDYFVSGVKKAFVEFCCTEVRHVDQVGHTARAMFFSFYKHRIQTQEILPRHVLLHEPLEPESDI